MLDRLLMVIHWVSLVSLAIGFILIAVIQIDCPRCLRKEWILATPFWGGYLVYVVILWIIKSRWIWFPWQVNRDKRGER